MKKVLEHVHLEPIVYRNFGVDLRTLLAISINVDNYNMIRAEACNSERINIQQKMFYRIGSRGLCYIKTFYGCNKLQIDCHLPLVIFASEARAFHGGAAYETPTVGLSANNRPGLKCPTVTNTMERN
jgi:hypothetical protein